MKDQNKKTSIDNIQTEMANSKADKASKSIEKGVKEERPTKSSFEYIINR